MKLIVSILLILVFILLTVGFIGVYQTNVFMPDKSPWTITVPADTVFLQTVLNSFSNYDLVSIIPVQGGYELTYKNRSKLVDMWQ